MVKRSSGDHTDDLTMAGFSLLNLILSGWFGPATSDPINEACRQARLQLVEESCDLCTLLLSAYDGNSLRSGHKGRGLAGDTLAVLLACSNTAKNTALKGECGVCVCVHLHEHVRLCVVCVYVFAWRCKRVYCVCVCACVVCV